MGWIRLPESWIGPLAVMGYVVIGAAYTVFIGHFVQKVHPMVIMTLTLAFATAFSVANQVSNWGNFIRKVKSHLTLVLKNCFSTFIAWAGYYYALKFIEPSIGEALMLATLPLFNILLWKWLRPHTPLTFREKVAAVGISLSVGILGLVSFMGFSGLREIPPLHLFYGLGSAAISGFFCLLSTHQSKSMSERGFSPTEIMTSRFPLLLLGGMALWPSGTSLADLPGNIWSAGLLMSVVGILIPIYLIQVGIARTEPMITSILMATAPAAVFLFQYFDDRTSFSLGSLLGVLGTIAFSLYGTTSPRKKSPQETPRKYAVIVDGYSSGRLIAPELKKRGYTCLHVQTSAAPPPYLYKSFQPQDYEVNFIFSGDFDELLGKLKTYPIEHVMVGCEIGVELADRLSETLGLRTNGTALSSARRNKALMYHTLKSQGIPVARFLQTNRLEHAVIWWRSLGAIPVVVKPLHSAGTDSVVRCETADELREAFEKFLGQTNRMGLRNEKLLVQEYLEGTEYVINTVSCDGYHYVCDFWRYEKQRVNGGSRVYDFDVLLPSVGTVQDELRRYVFATPDALGIRHGACHAEVMITSKGPRLIEIGARMDGMSGFALTRDCLDHLQQDLLIDAYLDPEHFRDKTREPYLIKKHAMCVSMIASVEGTVLAMPGLPILKSLPGFRAIQSPLQSGYDLKRTVDMFTSPGYISLVHEDRWVLEGTYQAIRDLERNGLYQLKSASSFSEAQSETGA